jgi:hypothetical protein
LISTYYQAIVKAIESLHNYQARSNIDTIRQSTQNILQDQCWNEELFMQTLRSIVDRGGINLFASSVAKPPSNDEKKRGDSLVHRLNERLAPSAPLSAPATTKELAHRRPEHDKWKIVPKKVSDHSTYVAFVMKTAAVL